MGSEDLRRTRQHFEQHTEQYVERYNENLVQLGKTMTEFVIPHLGAAAAEGLRILDLGSGGGGPADQIAAEGWGMEIVCVDLSAAMLKKQDKAKNKALIVGDVGSLPLRPATFDLVIVSALMHHLIDRSGYRATRANIAQFLRGLHGVLRPGGHVLIREVYHESRCYPGLGARALYHLSTVALPAWAARALRTVGVASQGGGVCFLTRPQWESVLRDTTYTLIAKQDLPWTMLPLKMRLAGFRSSGDILYLLTPS